MPWFDLATPIRRKLAMDLSERARLLLPSLPRPRGCSVTAV